MEQLLRELDKLYSDSDNFYVSEKDGRSYFKNDYDVKSARALCNDKLIMSYGRCNWQNVNILKEHGYIVFAGEKDRFGWLTGCLQKNGDSRILMYG